MKDFRHRQTLTGWRLRLHEILFEADTPMGKAFDLALICSILISVVTVMIDSVDSIRHNHADLLAAAEWLFTILFTIEYILRLNCVGRPLSYATSFYGIVDLLAIMPTYISLFLPGGHYLLVIRILRVLRLFRVLKLAQYLREAQILAEALNAGRRKITVFLFAVSTLIVIFGAIMYMIEGRENGFTSIPVSIYWAVVTLTTVGYGDISPQTSLGQAMAAIIMIIGYSIIAVPTGIVTAEITMRARQPGAISTQACPACSREGHDPDAKHCKYCGAML